MDINEALEAVNADIIFFDDSALIISDLGQSLSMLLGRHWKTKSKSKYAELNPSELLKDRTPKLTKLITRFLVPSGFNLPVQHGQLWIELKELIRVYNDIVKHFEYRKLDEAARITFEGLSRFMEVTRQTWIWFTRIHSKIDYDPEHDAFKPFKRSFCDLGLPGLAP